MKGIVAVKGIKAKYIGVDNQVLEGGSYNYIWRWRDSQGNEVSENNMMVYKITVSPGNLLYSYWYFKRKFTYITFWNKHGTVNAGGSLTVQMMGSIPSGTRNS